jgi:ubiquinol-cytochrome c reductase cytochrome b subunit
MPYRFFKQIYRWFDERLKLTPIRIELLEEPIPGGASWIYVFGSVTLFFFLLQMITGMFLAVYYAPTPDHAYDSVTFIERDVDFGRFIRGLHHWGASGMMVAIGLHMLQVFLYGAYKRPRELMWIAGVCLFLLTMAFGFTGYLLPWDQKAYWATQVGINIVGTIPVVGDLLVRVIRGGDTVGALTLSRFFSLHTLFLPWMTIGLIAAHLFILRRVGAAGPWDLPRGRQRSEPFYPKQVFMDAVAMFGGFLVLVLFAMLVPVPLADKADPADVSFTPVPEWYFLWYYQLLKYFTGPWEVVGTLVLPLLFYLTLFLLPWLDRRKERRPSSRPVVMLSAGLLLVAVFWFMTLSVRDIRAVQASAPDVAEGKELYAKLQCSGCHRIHGEGGAVGPDLSYEGDVRAQRWLTDFLRDPQAVQPGTIMPKFPLTEKELRALTGYLLSLKRPGA